MSIFFKAFQDKSSKSIKQADKDKMQRRPDKPFFNKLADFETRLLTDPTVELVNEVLSMYRQFNDLKDEGRQCVEYFDSQQEPIKYYFVDKIQNALAETRTFQVIRQQKKIEEQMTEEDPGPRSRRQKSMFEQPSWTKETVVPQLKTIIANECDLHSSQTLSSEGEEDRIKPSIKISPPGKLVPTKPQPTPITRKTRARLLTLQVQLQEQTEEQNDQLETMVGDFEEKTKDVDKLVRESLQTQAQSVQNRLAKRSIFSRTMNKPSACVSQRTLEEPTPMIAADDEFVPERRYSKTKTKTDDDIGMRRSSHLMVLPVQVTFTDELGKSKVL